MLVESLIGLEKMFSIYFMQQWFGLSDPAMEDALHDIESMRRFAGIELGADPVPDETTICKFRHLLEKHHLSEKLFEAVLWLPGGKGPVSQKGHHSRRHPDRRPVIHQEQGKAARCGSSSFLAACMIFAEKP